MCNCLVFRIVICFANLLFAGSSYTVSITTPKIEISVSDFTTIDMIITPTPSLPLSAIWVRKSIDGTETPIMIDNTDKYFSYTYDSLLIMNCDKNDVGYYTLYVTDGIESGYNEQTTLLMISGPPIVGSPFTQINEIPAGQTVTIPCVYVTGFNVILNVSWLHTNTSGISYYIDKTATNKYSGSNTSHPSLTIFNYDVADLGEYWCEVRNTLGTGSGNHVSLVMPATSPGIVVSSTSNLTTDISSESSTFTVTTNMASTSPFTTNIASTSPGTTNMASAFSVTTDIVSTIPMPFDDTRCGNYKSKYEMIYTRYAGRHVSVGLLSVINELSSVNCAMKCLQHGTCTGFSYQNTSGNCHLTNATVKDLLTNNDWDHYYQCL